MRALLLSLVLGPASSPAFAGRDTVPQESTWDAAESEAVQLELISVLIDSDQFDKALYAISEVRSTGTQGAGLDILQARALIGKGLPLDAVLLLDDKYMRNHERHRVVCLAQLDLGELDEAEAACRKALRYAPGDLDSKELAELHNNLGFILATENKHEEAVLSYYEALKLDPNLRRARNNLGFSQAALGRDDQALGSFRAALSPTLGFDAELLEGEAWYNLGVAQLSRGDTLRAKQSFLTALKHVPGHAQAQAALDGMTPNLKETP